MPQPLREPQRRHSFYNFVNERQTVWTGYLSYGPVKRHHLVSRPEVTRLVLKSGRLVAKRIEMARVQINQVLLFVLTAAVCVTIFGFNQNSAYKMAELTLQMEAMSLQGSCNVTAYAETSRELYNLAYTTATGGNIAFFVLIRFLTWHVFPVMKDLIERVKRPLQHWLFLIGLCLFIAGAIMISTSFLSYGAQNLINGTAMLTAGLSTWLFGDLSLMGYEYRKPQTSALEASLERLEHLADTPAPAAAPAAVIAISGMPGVPASGASQRRPALVQPKPRVATRPAVASAAAALKGVPLASPPPRAALTLPSSEGGDASLSISMLDPAFSDEGAANLKS